MLLFILLIILVFDIPKYTAQKSTYLRIYGGSDADVKKFPFAVAIEICTAKIKDGVKILKYIPLCSATALSSKWMLTAAHCIEPQNRLLPTRNSKGVIRYTSPTGEQHRRDILQMIRYPNRYSGPLFGRNDIALIKTMDLQLPIYAKLSSVDYTSLIGHEAVYLGYGITITRDQIRHAPENLTLKMMDVMVMRCDEIIVPLTPNICTVPKCNLKEFLCPGDSGGTMLHSSGVIGVHSASVGCLVEKNNLLYKRYNYAGIDAPVSPYIDWITNEITKHSP